jgi:hypothetical protein
MYCLQICQLVVVRVNADAEEKTCVSSVYDFVIAKLTKGGFEMSLTTELSDHTIVPQQSLIDISGLLGPLNDELHLVTVPDN